MKVATGGQGLVKDGTLRQQFAKAAELGYDAIELWVALAGDSNKVLNLDSKEEDYAKIRSLIKEFGVEVRSVASGAYWGVGAFGSSDPSKSADAIRILRKQIEAARAIGADTILVVTNLDKDTEYMQSIELTIKIFREMEERS